MTTTSLGAQSLEATARTTTESPEQKPNLPVKIWAFFGLLIVAFEVWVLIRWMTGPFFVRWPLVHVQHLDAQPGLVGEQHPRMELVRAAGRDAQRAVPVHAVRLLLHLRRRDDARVVVHEEGADALPAHEQAGTHRLLL